MRRVLIVGYPWPYIGGSKRVMGLTNYLTEYGWEPIILTAPLNKKAPKNLKIIETDYQGLLGGGVKVLGLNDRAPLGEQLKERVRGLSEETKLFIYFPVNPECRSRFGYIERRHGLSIRYTQYGFRVPGDKQNEGAPFPLATPSIR